MDNGQWMIIGTYFFASYDTLYNVRTRCINLEFLPIITRSDALHASYYYDNVYIVLVIIRILFSIARGKKLHIYKVFNFELKNHNSSLHFT